MKEIFILILCMNTAALLTAQDRITGRHFATRSEVIATHGMACTSHPLASQIAIDVLKEGGNAIDAAIAANAALGLMEPTGCGIGGDIFAIIWSAEDQKLYGLNGSGRSPRKLNRSYFLDQGYSSIPAFGPLPVSVPGAVDGWFALHEKFGSKPMSEVLAPAIYYAEEGFPVTELIAYYLQRSLDYFGSRYPHVMETYSIEGRAPRKGDVFKNSRLAKTYRRLAVEGRDAFYLGSIADTIVTFIQDQGGFLSKEDMATHRSEWVDPVSVNYRGYDVWELPPNGQGIAALQMLNILEAYDIASLGYGSPDHVHYFVEAKKLAFEDRARYYADPDFANVPLDTLLSKDYADKRRALIADDKAGRYKGGDISQGETIYLTVADEEGNMVSLIQSNYRGMGSGMVPPGLGFMLQDRGELFSLETGHYNVYEPAKRPFHTIIPCFVTKDGKPFMSFGVMGGDFQPMGHVQVLMNIIDFGMNVQEAGDAPRMGHDGGSSPTGKRIQERGEIYLETGYPYHTIRELMSRGHKVTFKKGVYGGYQAIMRDLEKGVYYGASESRKDGQAVGY